ncbi:ribose 5-phosphate isomerase B [Candidatus Zixiibacteriota bacterium]
MKIFIGADHKGYLLKQHLISLLQGQGHEITDVGTDSEESCDYPDYGLQVARAVAAGQAERGITVCWTGNGMNIAANKIPGVRAGLCLNEDMAKLARAHNNANVCSLASRYVSPADAEKIIHVFLSTAFEGGRHIQRLEKIAAAEKK